MKNILFLADRNSLVTQAKRSFVNMLPNLSCSNLVEEKDNYNAHCIFSTYQTMINCIDTVGDDEGKLFTCGHFDLVICDEAHRSIYNKYKDIFTYFDAPLVGLTATPKDEIDKNTYEVFELENGVPTYGYDLAQAVKDGYLVDYVSVESKLKFIEQGIVYDELSDEDKEAYEETFEGEQGEMPEAIASSALNTWIFNEDTIKQVLNTLMTEGIKIDYGQKIGKTIIFAKNHDHAEKILEVFQRAAKRSIFYYGAGIIRKAGAKNPGNMWGKYTGRGKKTRASEGLFVTVCRFTHCHFADRRAHFHVFRKCREYDCNCSCPGDECSFGNCAAPESGKITGQSEKSVCTVCKSHPGREKERDPFAGTGSWRSCGTGSW